MGRIFKGGRGGVQFENPYNFPLTISMTEPAPKAVGHIWVKSDAGAQITNVVIDDAFRESYPDGTLLLKESAKDEDYTLTCAKKDTSGVKRNFSYSRPCTENTLNWTAGSLNKNGAVYTAKHLYPLLYTKLNGVIDIENAFVWTGTTWETLCQKGALLATGSVWDENAYSYVSCLNVFSIAEDDFIYTPDTQIVSPYRGWSGLQFSPDGKYLIGKRNMHRDDVADPVINGIHVYKRSGITFTDISSTFFSVFTPNDYSNLYSFSHDGKRFCIATYDRNTEQYAIVIGHIIEDVFSPDLTVNTVNSKNGSPSSMSSFFSWSTDDKYITCAVTRGLLVINATTGELKSTGVLNQSETYFGVEFISNTNDILAFIRGGTETYHVFHGMRVYRFNAEDGTFTIISTSKDDSVTNATKYFPSVDSSYVNAAEISEDGQYVAIMTTGGASYAGCNQGIAKLQIVNGSYIIKPLYSYAATDNRQGTIFIPGNRVVIYGRGKVEAFTVDPVTDVVIPDASTTAKFNDKHIPFGAGYFNSMTYFNWNGGTT